MSRDGNVLRRAGVSAARSACDPAAPDGCAVCGDEALRARVLSVDTRARSASVLLLEVGTGGVAGPATAGAVLVAALDLVDGVAIGDLVLVHQGFVIGREETP